MAVQGKHRFTTQEYHRMGETGVLRPDARVELIDGEIIDMSPIGPFHSGVVGDLSTFFVEISNGRWLVRSQSPLFLDENSEPQPDVMLLRLANHRYRKTHPRPEDVYLLVEVSDTTLDFDRANKLPAYGRAGIPEVWIVNLVEQNIEIYREPNFTGYAMKAILLPGEKAIPQGFPDVSLAVDWLLKK